MQSRIACAFLSNISSLFEYVKILIILIVKKINTYLNIINSKDIYWWVPLFVLKHYPVLIVKWPGRSLGLTILSRNPILSNVHLRRALFTPWVYGWVYYSGGSRPSDKGGWGGGSSHLDPEIREGGLQKIFSALQTSVWSKNKGGGGLQSSPWSATVLRWFSLLRQQTKSHGITSQMNHLWQYYSHMQGCALRKSEGWYYLFSNILQLKLNFFFNFLLWPH